MVDERIDSPKKKAKEAREMMRIWNNEENRVNLNNKKGNVGDVKEEQFLCLMKIKLKILR